MALTVYFVKLEELFEREVSEVLPVKIAFEVFQVAFCMPCTERQNIALQVEEVYQSKAVVRQKQDISEMQGAEVNLFPVQGPYKNSEAWE